MKRYEMIPEGYAWRFKDDRNSRLFANLLLEYVAFSTKPKITPTIWQDVEIFIRYTKRDVWSLEDWQIENAERGIMLYRAKYAIEHLTKTEIIEIFNQFYKNTDLTFLKLFEKKFHAPIDSLFLVQEKHVITKDKINNFDQLFEYPAWLEFDETANQAIFNKIYKGELTDEQIDYFLGASDDMKNYSEWFKVAKHILLTTENAHTFWTAGDVLSIIRRAIPEDGKSQKWFNDQIFEIFWSRVKNVWPMLNQDKIDFDYDEETKILKDSIGWLETLSDLKERLPELGEKYELINYKKPEEEFAYDEGFLLGRLHSGKASISELMSRFFELVDITCSEQCVESLKQITEEELIPIIKNSKEDIDTEKAISLIQKAVQRGEEAYQKLKIEGENISKNLTSD